MTQAMTILFQTEMVNRPKLKENEENHDYQRRTAQRKKKKEFC